MYARRHDPPWRNTRRNLEGRTSGQGGWPSRSTICAVIATYALRPLARSGEPPHRVGVLSCSTRLRSGHAPAVERQLERFAPGFRDGLIARSVRGPRDIERDNPNLVGGDIAAGATTLGQLFTRPTWRTYSTPVRGLYICSASTPPGAGVHGMCGYFAAQRALGEALRD